MTATIEPFTLDVPQAQLDDLTDRLAGTRWPERETVDDTSQGPPLAKLKALVEHWRDGYDWRRCEALLNGFGQCRTTIDGLGIHFLQVRSAEPEAMPLLLAHGWPGSVLEFRHVIDRLTDPVAHGAESGDAFHLVIPSMPGFGFSDKPDETGWGISRIADAWIELLDRLGYAPRSDGSKRAMHPSFASTSSTMAATSPPWSNPSPSLTSFEQPSDQSADGCPDRQDRRSPPTNINTRATRGPGGVGPLALRTHQLGIMASG